MIPRELRVRAYQDNEGEVRIGFATPDEIVDAAMRQFDQDRQDRELAEKLIAMDAMWASTPMEDAMGLADKLHEVTRDADLEIRRLKRRCNALIGGGLCIASGCLVVGVLIGAWLA